MKHTTAFADEEATILTRLIKPQKKLPAAAARALLKLDFSPSDRKRMQHLLEKAQAGTLTPAERRLAECYSRAAHVLALFHSKARRSLKETPARKQA
jgi:hypothetical protein